MSTPIRLVRDPQSVRTARRWVTDELQRLGREDLADAAELGISELVTNAMLHADSPITVRLGGTPQHPRVEVHDNSRQAPVVNTHMAEDDKLLRTVGRGLGIVALYSTSWGADLSPDGKIVWFEPAAQPRLPDIDLDFPADQTDDAGAGADPIAESMNGDVYDLTEVVDELLAKRPDPEQLFTVVLLGMPARVFGSYRVWYAEIRRELRLLSFVHGGEYPAAAELAEITLQAEQERRQATGIRALDVAIAADVDRIDLEYVVPSSAADTMSRLADLLDRVDEFCREHDLLTMAAAPQIVELRRWYLGEFARQATGLEPRPWPGSYDVESLPA
jgi:anti-sigma regulatory factor (Ser/Thr protein kinase)